jgi:hypothetical protein
MVRVVVCLLIVLTTTSFKMPESRQQSSDVALLGKIEEAREMLKDQTVQLLKGVVGTKRVRVSRRRYTEVPVMGIVGREMAIAVLDSEGGIQVARAIKRDGSLEVLSSGFVFSVRRENGVNSDIAVISPKSGKVLAVKYPVSNEGNRFGPGGPVIQAVYTPYSPEIGTGEVIAEGIRIQSELIDKAYARLDKQAVFSSAYPGKKVSDVIPKDVLTVLLMNEHIDPALFRSAGLAKTLVEQVLTVVATNREKAYAYSISSAGARGLVQMIPSTYSLIARKYPAARLNPSFVEGMTDPINAIMAQVLLCDADWQSIRTRKEIGPDRIGPYLAAAYNGGVGRVLNILKHDETDWMEEPEGDRKPMMTVTRQVPVKVRTKRGRTRTAYVMKSYAQPIFKSETSKYVRQYHWINDFFVARNVDGFKPRPEVK